MMLKLSGTQQFLVHEEDCNLVGESIGFAKKKIEKRIQFLQDIKQDNKMAPYSRIKYLRIPLDSFRIRLPIDASYIPEERNPQLQCCEKFRSLTNR